MIFNYFTLLTALALSASAIFYSVSGLAIIFAGAVLPVIIMGTILEVSKLVAAVWLHRNWNYAVWWLKTYLTIAVLILMVITSMGIFGYLSKSHIQQTADNDEQIAKIQNITENLIISNAKVTRWNKELTGLVDGTNIRVDSVLAREQKELDAVYARMEAEHAKIQKAGDSDVSLQSQRLDQAQARKDSAIQALGSRPNRGDVSRLQQQEVSVASRAQKEIVKIQANTKELLRKVEPKYTEQIAEIQDRITKLKNKSGNSAEDIEKKIVKIEDKILVEQKIIDKLSTDKSVYQSRNRQLEAEVGPIRYIAAFIYNDETNQNMLEEAVRWVIVIIIVVFDPLAVLLLIATQYSFSRRKEELKLKELVHKEVVEEVDHVIHDEHGDFPDDWPLVSDDHIPDMPDVKPAKEETKEYEINQEFTALDASIDVWWSDSLTPDKEKVEDELDILYPDYSKKPLLETDHDPIGDEEIKKLKQSFINDSDDAMTLINMGDGYVNYNGKAYKLVALTESHPELELNFMNEVQSGEVFTNNDEEGKLFLRTDMFPTQLFRYNGNSWDNIDKNLLEYPAYSNKYINKLIAKVGNNEYNPELLNEMEKQHIEKLLAR